MSVLFVLVPVALVTVLAAVVAFVWAARKGQFDDLVTPALRALHDDEEERPGDTGSRSTESNDAKERRSGPTDRPER